MEIGGLGFVNTIAASSTKDVSGTSGTEGFSGVFQSIVQGRQSAISESESGTADPSQQLFETDIQELINYLNLDDILDVENGLKLLDQTLSTSESNLLEIIQEYLGLSDSDLKEAILKLRNMISQGISSQTTINGNNEESEKHEDSQSDSLVSLMGLIAGLSQNDFKLFATKDFAQVVKTVKLLDILAGQQDHYGEGIDATNVLKNIKEKLEQLLQSQKSMGRTEYLHKTFSPIAVELNKKLGAQGISEKSLIGLQIKPLNEGQTTVKVLPTLEGDTNQQIETEISGAPFQIQQMSKPEQLTLMLEKNGKPVSTDQLIQQFESILSKSTFTKADGIQRLLLKLNPEHLGSVQIELVQKDSSMVAKILTTTGLAKDALESQLSNLKQAFQAQNIQIDRIEVSQTLNQNERFFNRDQQGREQQRQEQQPRKDDNEKGENYSITFEEALLNTEV